MILNRNIYDIAIIGGGIIGCAFLYILSKYTNIEKIIMIERNKDVGLENSNMNNNSKTLHEGFAETNYSMEKVKRMKFAGKLIRNYIKKSKIISNMQNLKIFSYIQFLTLAIDEEIEFLERCFYERKSIFPEIQLLTKKELTKIEPAIVKGRPEEERIECIYKKDGLAIDFGGLARVLSMESLSNEKIKLALGEEVVEIKEKTGLYEINTRKRTFLSNAILLACSANSYYLARRMGYLEGYSLANVRGNYFRYPNILRGKVYRVQTEEIPLLQIHADPNPFLDYKFLEIGPTSEVIFSKNYSKDFEFNYFYREIIKNKKLMRLIYEILKDDEIRGFLLRNYLYKIPKLGRKIFAGEARKIIPSLREELLEFRRGGVRPQLIDEKQAKLILGDRQFRSDKAVIMITPSPGASASILNAIENAIYFSQVLDKRINIEGIMNFFEIDNEELKLLQFDT